jgi:glycosyltransferase involved in cell wall biosynthesis
VESFVCREDKEDFYVTASRMVPYKKVSLIVEAFTKMPDKKLVVIGDGPDFAKIKAMAGPNVTLLGFQSSSALRDYMQRAKAFVFAAEEDFGIAPVEAQAAGTPVIAYGKGGALETICGLNHPVPTGVFFNEQTASSLIAAVEEFERHGSRIKPSDCRANAQRFSIQTFQSHVLQFVNSVTLERDIALLPQSNYANVKTLPKSEPLSAMRVKA